jgi:hypothetical protein
MNAIGMRFFNFKAELKVHSLLTRQRATDYWIGFRPMVASLNFAEKHSVVPFEHGHIYYIYPGQRPGQGSRRDAFATQYATKPFGGVVYEDEIYYLHSGKGRGQTTLDSEKWPPLALDWGLAHATDHISILVELNPGTVRTNIDRTHLHTVEGDVEIKPNIFAEAVRDNMPEWVRELESSLAPKPNETNRNTQQYLLNLMREFRNMQDAYEIGGDEPARDHEHNVGPGPGPGGPPGPGPGPQPGPRPGPHPDPRGDKTTRLRRSTMNAPLAELVNNEWMKDRAGSENVACRFMRSVGAEPAKLYFNEEHPFFQNLIERIIAKLPEAAPDAQVRPIAKAIAKDIWHRVAGTQVVSTIALLSVKITEGDMWATLGDLVLTATVAGSHLTKHFADGVKHAREQYHSISTQLVREIAWVE